MVRDLKRALARRLGEDCVQPAWPLGVAAQVNVQIKEHHLDVKARYPHAISLARVCLQLRHPALQCTRLLRST